MLIYENLNSCTDILHWFWQNLKWLKKLSIFLLLTVFAKDSKVHCWLNPVYISAQKLYINQKDLTIWLDKNSGLQFSIISYHPNFTQSSEQQSNVLRFCSSVIRTQSNIQDGTFCRNSTNNFQLLNISA